MHVATGGGTTSAVAVIVANVLSSEGENQEGLKAAGALCATEAMATTSLSNAIEEAARKEEIEVSGYGHSQASSNHGSTTTIVELTADVGTAINKAVIMVVSPLCARSSGKGKQMVARATPSLSHPLLGLASMGQAYLRIRMNGQASVDKFF